MLTPAVAPLERLGRVLRRTSALVSAALAIGSCAVDERAPSLTSEPPGADGGGAASATVGALLPGSTSCPGCVVDGACVASGTRGPGPCDICDPVRAAGGWSFNEGAGCDDGLFCTVDEVCRAGACSGSPRICEDGVVCNGVSTCDEAAAACTPFVNLCGEGALCDSDGECVTGCDGCAIAGSCVPSGAEQPGNPCRVCDPAQSTTDYVAAVGKACGAPAGACSEQDACNGAGVCEPRHLPDETSCGQNDACQLDDTCRAGVCVPGVPLVCSLDTVCDPSTGACACVEGQSRCTNAQLQRCDGGNFIAQVNCQPGTRCDAVAQRCVCEEDADPSTTVVDHPSFGCGYETRANGDRWVFFPDQGVEFDPINGNAWSAQGTLTAAGLASACAALKIEGITGWRLPTINEARTLSVGCPSTAACPLTDPGCSSSDCAQQCGACTPLGPGNDYCRASFNLCATLHTTSPCTSCTSNSTWGYDGVNGGFFVTDVTTRSGAACIRTGISL